MALGLKQRELNFEDEVLTSKHLEKYCQRRIKKAIELSFVYQAICNMLGLEVGMS